MYTGSRAGAGTSVASKATILRKTLFNTLLVLSVSKVDLKVIHRHAWSWRVELPGTVVAADSRKILVFDLLALLEVVWIGHWGKGVHVNGGVPHDAFKGVVGVGLFESAETGGQPTWRWGT